MTAMIIVRDLCILQAIKFTVFKTRLTSSEHVNLDFGESDIYAKIPSLGIKKNMYD